MGNCYSDEHANGEGDVMTGGVDFEPPRLTVKERFITRITENNQQREVEIREGTPYIITQTKPGWVEIKLVRSRQRVWIKNTQWEKLGYSRDEA